MEDNVNMSPSTGPSNPIERLKKKKKQSSQSRPGYQVHMVCGYQDSDCGGPFNSACEGVFRA